MAGHKKIVRRTVRVTKSSSVRNKKAVNGPPHVRPTFLTSTSKGGSKSGAASAGSASKSRVVKNPFSSSTGAATRVGPKGSGGARTTKVRGVSGNATRKIKNTFNSSTGKTTKIGKHGSTGTAMRSVKVVSKGNAKKIIGGNPRTRGAVAKPVVKRKDMRNGKLTGPGAGTVPLSRKSGRVSTKRINVIRRTVKATRKKK